MKPVNINDINKVAIALSSEQMQNLWNTLRTLQFARYGSARISRGELLMTRQRYTQRTPEQIQPNTVHIAEVMHLLVAKPLQAMHCLVGETISKLDIDIRIAN